MSADMARDGITVGSYSSLEGGSSSEMSGFTYSSFPRCLVHREKVIWSSIGASKRTIRYS